MQPLKDKNHFLYWGLSWMTFLLRNFVTLFYWLGGVDFLGNILTLEIWITISENLWSNNIDPLTYLMNWMAGTLFLLMISVTNIMARLLITCGALFGVNCLVKWFMNKVAFSVLDGRAELFVSSLVISLALWLICRIALCLYLILENYFKI